MVIVAGAVVAVALIAVLGAVLQLGYHPGHDDGDGLTPPEETRRVVTEVLDTEEETVRESAWEDRQEAVAALQIALEERFQVLERTPIESIRRVRFAPEMAAERLAELCPRGPGQQFGPCVAIDGVIVQDRGGSTHLVAVVLRVTVTTDESESVVTIVVRPTLGVEER